ncbi:hypothetical protein LSCM1_02255 [Leishmania martiniquensis]|uniref:Coiled-coil domain-containing protein 6 n=1 Tax=Leishmania martiniquensis TaxID=1580590 RepID=A0A836KDB9_9TRYP|nr:hypothetical protein LSCM1_02255 [Leishmania martiniquensis]
MPTISTSRSDVVVPVNEMPIERLRREYVSLKSTSYSLAVEESHLIRKIETLREESFRTMLDAEVKEEQVSNQLFRRLDGAEKEVQRYQRLLKEEEMEAESLSTRIKEMRSQQTEVENALEERQEYLLMNLQRKLLDMARKKTAVEQELMAERQKYLDVLVTRLNMLRGRGAGSSSESSMIAYSQPSLAEASLVPVEKRADVALPPPASLLPPVPPLTMAMPAGDSHSMPSSEKSLRADACSGATISLTPASTCPSLPQRKVKDSFSVTLLRGNPNATSGRASASTTPHSADLTPRTSHSSETHHAVAALERKLNQLLLEQAAAMQRSSATEKQCAELAAKLHAVQEATFLDRARASRMKEELEKARARLSEMQASGSAGIPSSSFDDTTVMSTLDMSFDHSASAAVGNLSLAERTRELLSSLPPPTSH